MGKENSKDFEKNKRKHELKVVKKEIREDSSKTGAKHDIKKFKKES